MALQTRRTVPVHRRLLLCHLGYCRIEDCWRKKSLTTGIRRRSFVIEHYEVGEHYRKFWTAENRRLTYYVSCTMAMRHVFWLVINKRTRSDLFVATGKMRNTDAEWFLTITLTLTRAPSSRDTWTLLINQLISCVNKFKYLGINFIGTIAVRARVKCELRNCD